MSVDLLVTDAPPPALFETLLAEAEVEIVVALEEPLPEAVDGAG